MKPRLLDYLRCPDCGGGLTLSATERDADEIAAGTLACGACARTFAIRGGVPRFADAAALGGAVDATARNFGAQWQVFDEVAPHHEQQLKDWLAPVTPEFVRGKIVLEGGCGKGRHTRLLASWGAAEVIAIDLSDAVDVAYRHTRHLPNAHIVQADIHRLPFAAPFDFAFSIGVLHHLPDPRAGFARLCRHVRRGGAVSVWVYGRENNGWIVRFVDPVRTWITSRLGPRPLYAAALAPAALLFGALRGVYGPLRGTALGRRLPYRAFLQYIAPFPFREVHTIVFDHLTAPVAFYLRGDEVRGWFSSAGARDVRIEWHNENSWRGFGVV